MRIKTTDGPYKGSPPYEASTQLEVEVTRVKDPEYQGILDWMKTAQGRHVSYDFWQRGNYTRRLIQQRRYGLHPIYVQVSYVDEMRWAYRRLALLGLPIEFVYCGDDCRTGLVLHRIPSDFMIDAGWGYFVGATKGPRDEVIPVCTGHAHLLPQTAVDWLVEEASRDFLEGRISVAPAAVIGIDGHAETTNLNPLASLTGGMSLMPDQGAAQVLMDLELPYLDRISPGNFTAFLREHQDDLRAFQGALKNLVGSDSESESKAQDLVAEIRHEVTELMKSQQSSRVRRTAALLDGALTTVPAALIAAQDPTDPLLWSVAAGAAGTTLRKLWSQRRETKARSFALLWHLGLTSPDRVRTRRTHKYKRIPGHLPGMIKPHPAHHWLCPPIVGAQFVSPSQRLRALRDERRKTSS